MPRFAQSHADGRSVPAPSNPALPVETSHRLERVFALLLVPFLIVGYYLAITLLKLAGRSHH